MSTTPVSSPVLGTNLTLLALALIAGVAIAYQPGINARFADHAGSRIWGSVFSFAVGLAALVIVAIAMRAAPPSFAKLSQGPWWMWVGGFCGAFYVTIALMLVPRLGAATFLTATIAGQLLASLIIDHFGYVGLPTHAVSPGRVLGVLLVLAGMAMVKYL